MVPWLLEQLQVTELRQDRISRGLRTGSRPVAPLLFNPDAGDVRVALVNAVTTWARHIAEARQRRGPGGSAEVAEYWLGEYIGAVRLDEAAGEIYGEITRAVAAGLVAINPAPMLTYRGPCPTIVGRTPQARAISCALPLYADRAEPFVICPNCGIRHDVARLEQRLLAHIGGRTFGVRELVRVLRELGEPVPRGTIVSWIHRGQLRARGRSEDGKPLYRLEDARKLRSRAPQARGSTA
jgi:hypothetical protein